MTQGSLGIARVGDVVAARRQHETVGTVVRDSLSSDKDVTSVDLEVSRGDVGEARAGPRRAGEHASGGSSMPGAGTGEERQGSQN